VNLFFVFAENHANRESGHIFLIHGNKSNVIQIKMRKQAHTFKQNQIYALGTTLVIMMLKGFY